MPIITLTTDWSHRDYYLGALKGRLLSICKDVNLVDLSQNLDKHNISQTAFSLKNTYHHFPKETIHLVCVNSEETPEHPTVAIQYHGQYFIGADNGVFSLIMKEGADAIVRIENIIREPEYHTFPEINIFAKAAAYITEYQTIEGLGTPLTELYKLVPIRCVVQKGTITGQVIYLDSHGNVTTNISKELFESARQDRNFEIFVQSIRYCITTINKNYYDTSEGEILAIFNASGLLEIAINKGKLGELTHIDINADIRIKFHDN